MLPPLQRLPPRAFKAACNLHELNIYLKRAYETLELTHMNLRLVDYFLPKFEAAAASAAITTLDWRTSFPVIASDPKLPTW